jgi:hypothetical protein
MILITSSKTLLYHMFLEMQLISMAQVGTEILVYCSKHTRIPSQFLHEGTTT